MLGVPGAPYLHKYCVYFLSVPPPGFNLHLPKVEQLLVCVLVIWIFREIEEVIKFLLHSENIGFESKAGFYLKR